MRVWVPCGLSLVSLWFDFVSPVGIDPLAGRFWHKWCACHKICLMIAPLFWILFLQPMLISHMEVRFPWDTGMSIWKLQAQTSLKSRFLCSLKSTMSSMFGNIIFNGWKYILLKVLCCYKWRAIQYCLIDRVPTKQRKSSSKRNQDGGPSANERRFETCVN